MVETRVVENFLDDLQRIIELHADDLVRHEFTYLHWIGSRQGFSSCNCSTGTGNDKLCRHLSGFNSEGESVHGYDLLMPDCRGPVRQHLSEAGVQGLTREAAEPALRRRCVPGSSGPV